MSIRAQTRTRRRKAAARPSPRSANVPGSGTPGAAAFTVNWIPVSVTLPSWSRSESSRMVLRGDRKVAVDRCQSQELHLCQQARTADAGCIARKGIGDSRDRPVARRIGSPHQRSESQVGDRQKRSVLGIDELQDSRVEQDVELVCPDVLATVRCHIHIRKKEMPAVTGPAGPCEGNGSGRCAGRKCERRDRQNSCESHLWGLPDQLHFAPRARNLVTATRSKTFTTLSRL